MNSGTVTDADRTASPLTNCMAIGTPGDGKSTAASTPAMPYHRAGSSEMVRLLYVYA
jgi:hypothetical protein